MLKQQVRAVVKSKTFTPFEWQNISPAPVIGVDEVGRGCLAGPVYAAAAIININRDYSQYTDSKALSAKRREEYCVHIKANHQVCVGFATIEEISKLNILQASLLAMKRAVEGLGYKSGHVLVDGNKQIPNLIGFQQTTIVKGDLRVSPIAAASIVAKVTRDQLMIDAAKEFPLYGFEMHKGYCTKAHKEAIASVGPCRLHRPTFAGVKEYL